MVTKPVEIKEFCFHCLNIQAVFNIYELSSVRTVCKNCGKTVDFQVKDTDDAE